MGLASAGESRTLSELRWRLLGVGSLLLVGVCLLFAFQHLWRLIEQPVRAFDVQSPELRLNNQKIHALLEPSLGMPLWDVDLAALQASLESEPWVRRVTLQRQWPGVLQLQVEEELPVARWGEAGLLNHEGEVFWPSMEPAHRALPMLQGPKGSAREMMQRYRSFNHQLRSLGLEVRDLKLEERGAWTLVLNNGLQLLVGRDPVMEKMQRFKQLYPRVLKEKAEQIERIDIRYTNGLAIGWRKPVEQAEKTGRT